MTKVLLADNDQLLTNEIQRVFSDEGFDVDVASEAVSASTKIFEKAHDLIVIDLALTGLDGFEICHCFRESGGTAPILITSPHQSIEHEERILHLGADDFVAKPFEARELLTRAKAALRRTVPQGSATSNTLLKCGDLEIDIASATVRKNGQRIILYPMEFNLLEFMMRHLNQPFSSAALAERVWKDRRLENCDTVRTHIKTLRRKIDNPGQPSMIKTEYRRGYKLVEPN